MHFMLIHGFFQDNYIHQREDSSNPRQNTGPILMIKNIPMKFLEHTPRNAADG